MINEDNVIKQHRLYAIIINTNEISYQCYFVKTGTVDIYFF